MDPLSQIVSLLKPERVSAIGLDAAGAWSLAFGHYQGIKFNAVVAGDCWLSMDGLEAPLRISAGDCFLVTQGTPFLLATDLKADLVPAEDVIKIVQGAGAAVLNGGGAFFLFGSRFILDDEPARFLLSSLPPLVHIPAADREGNLAWALERLQAELRDTRPGGHLAVHHLAHLMLVEVLRRSAPGGPQSRGWLQALSDRKIAPTLMLMHGDPARRWTVSDLADEAGMSRTSFAVRFKARVGMAPLDYLTRWRMSLASERLASSTSGIGAIAVSLGYESESAFGAAFKRVMGVSPRRYARTRSSSRSMSGNAPGPERI